MSHQLTCQARSRAHPPPRSRAHPPQIESTSLLASTTPQIDLETEPTEDNAAKDDDSFPVELPIEISQDPLLEPLPEPIRKIWVNDHFYDILEIIFLRQGLVGCGTAIGGNKEALNEIKMMEKMKGVCGVLQLVEYWLVEVTPGKYKLLVLVWDIMQIQKGVVEQHNFLHHNCSLFNAMIKDDGNGTHRMLIDWEFAGTLSFMSQVLLLQLYLKTPIDVLKLKGALS
ncbi:hypothetical protein BDR04DRAFT_1115877 [Suillus decipiens]|nr:hypothetical protein BDR04DRAFT_1115877 [Suillus decipiens]